MSEFVLLPPSTPAVAVGGESARFAVRRIFCVGQNYASHAREMGSDPNRQPPFFFMKPATAVLADGATLPYPSRTANLHHEAELVVAIRGRGQRIGATEALRHLSTATRSATTSRVATCRPPPRTRAGPGTPPRASTTPPDSVRSTPPRASGTRAEARFG